MDFYRKPGIKDAAFRQMLPVVLVTSLGILLLAFLIRTDSFSRVTAATSDKGDEDPYLNNAKSGSREKPMLPIKSKLSILLEKKNSLPPRNLELYPNLAMDHIVIVLYVHNRPQYLQVVVESLSHVEGINETLLIVSHDGYFEEMNKIVEGILFCQVKQIFSPYSPHLYPDSFPGISMGDCRDKDDPSKNNCRGNPDQYGNHRSPNIVSLKHHWWWMMNTVWDGLEETHRYSGHILFIEEDHFIFPNAYRNIQRLTKLKPEKCPDCYAANLAPSVVTSKGEGWESFIAEKIGNVGYAFNRTVWRRIHSKASEFCFFDDYNWDITMWATVYPSFGGHVYTLRGPRSSAVHFGKCGLHQGQGKESSCIDNGVVNMVVEVVDKVANIKAEWGVYVYERQSGYKAGFKGWGVGVTRGITNCAWLLRKSITWEIAEHVIEGLFGRLSFFNRFDWRGRGYFLLQTLKKEA